MRYALLVSYDGTNYGGWQVQNNCVSVQEKLEAAAEELFGTKTAVTASGRTDAGVHARGQVCHLDAQTTVPPGKIADALNMRLPDDISVLASAKAPDGFDANRSAKKKTYCYRMYFSLRRNPLSDRYSVWVKGNADIQKMQYVLRFFEGEHDFSAYAKSGSAAKTFTRTIYSATLSAIPSERALNVEIYLTGNGFLYNMVRTIAGTALYFAQGALSEEKVIKSLETGNRELVGKTMPAKGLTLESVDYGLGIFDL